MNFVCNLVDHVIFYCLQSSVGRAVTDIATETSHAVAEVVQPDVAIVSIRDAPILVLYRTTGIEPIPAFLMVSANTVVCLHIIDHKDISIAELKITVAISQFPTIITHFGELVNIFGPFSDYLIGHPLTLQAAATVV